MKRKNQARFFPCLYFSFHLTFDLPKAHRSTKPTILLYVNRILCRISRILHLWIPREKQFVFFTNSVFSLIIINEKKTRSQ